MFYALKLVFRFRHKYMEKPQARQNCEENKKYKKNLKHHSLYSTNWQLVPRCKKIQYSRLCVYVTRVPTFKLLSDTGRELMCSDKADLKSSKVQVVDKVI